MKEIKKSLEHWLNELLGHQVGPYEKFPDIDLYMDQVLTYLDKVLNIYSISSLDKQITSSMINNYVKGDVIPNPLQKKYTREHISLLLEISTLKRVLSIAEIKQILDLQLAKNFDANTINEFLALESNLIKEVTSSTVEKLTPIAENDLESIAQLALELALNANANIVIAQRILAYIRLYQHTQEELEEEKKKKEEESKERKKAQKELQNNEKNKSEN